MAKQHTIPTIQSCVWQDVRQLVQSLNSDLAEAIDQFDPDDRYTLYRVKYPYGTNLLKENEKIAELPSGSLPMGLVLNKCVEMFQTVGDRHLPFSLFGPGKLFGLWRSLDPQLSFHSDQLWTLTAGARSVFMLPKLTDKHAHHRLAQHFALKSPVPRHAMQQWACFVDIAKNAHHADPWQCEVLYFSKEWLTPQNTARWQQFHHYLLQCAWNETQFWRNQFIWDVTFSRIQANRNLRPDPYLADTVKHLWLIGTGVVPGFSVATDDSAAPISLLQQVYVDIYNLRNYVPLFMQARHFQQNTANAPLYYSLQNPTTLEFSPKARTLSSFVTDLMEVRHIINVSAQELASGKVGLQDSPLYHLTKQLQFDYFHSKENANGEIRASTELPDYDVNMRDVSDQFSSREFPSNSPFLKGCIGLTRQ